LRGATSSTAHQAATPAPAAAAAAPSGITLTKLMMTALPLQLQQAAGQHLLAPGKQHQQQQALAEQDQQGLAAAEQPKQMPRPRSCCVCMRCWLTLRPWSGCWASCSQAAPSASRRRWARVGPPRMMHTAHPLQSTAV
jgi:hypothetical protein